MTSEPESTRRRRPPTIDLTATEIETEREAETGGAQSAAGDRDGAPAAEQKRTSPRGAANYWPHAAAAAAGAIVMAALATGLWFSGVIPSPNPGAAAGDNAAAGKLSAQLDRIQTELQAQPAQAALSGRLATVEAQTKTLNQSLAALDRRLDDIAVTAQSASRRADAASAAAQGASQQAHAASAAVQNAAKNAVKQSDLLTLSDRIDALQRSIAALSSVTTHDAAAAGDRAARVAVAALALQSAVERGAPYQHELVAVKSLGADTKAVSALAPFAASGIPAASELAHQLSQIVASMQKLSAPPPAKAHSLLARLEDNAKSLVRVTPIDAPAEDGGSSALARLHADAAQSDIGAAIADIGRLPASLKTIAEPWMQKAEARNAAIAASRRIAADAVAGLGKPDSTQ